MKKLILKTIFIGLLILIFSGIAEAQIGIPDEYSPDNMPLDINFETKAGQGAASLTISVLSIIAGGLLGFAGPVAVILIIVNAFKMAKGGADSEELEQAKKGLTWTIIGLLLIILSWGIVRTVIKTSIEIAENTSISAESSGSSGETPPPT